MSDIRVLIGDDHRIVREGLKQMLGDLSNGLPAMVVRGEAQTGPEVLEAVQALGGPEGLDVVLLDIALPAAADIRTPCTTERTPRPS